MKHSHWFLIVFIFVLTLSCVTPIKDFAPISSNSLLTIDATLADQPKAYKVLLSYSSTRISGNNEDTPIKEASVSVTDDLGVKEKFVEIGAGVYQSSDTYHGVAGRAYTLDILLKDGKHYQSTPQKLSTAPPIDAIHSPFVPKTNYPVGNPQRVGFDVTLDFQDSATPNQYYQWFWTHYERTVYCLYCNNGYPLADGTCGNSNLPSYESQNSDRPIHFGCSSNCFDVVPSPTYNILSDNLINGQKVTNIPIARVPYNDKLTYYLSIEQRSISSEIYQYLRSLKNATENTGTLFDIPVETPLSPNIQSLTIPNEKILGAFMVFGLQEKIINIDRSVGTDGYEPVRIVYAGRNPISRGAFLPTAPCIESKYRSNKVPKDWPEK